MGWDVIGTLLDKYGLPIGILFGIVFAIMKGYLVPGAEHERVKADLLETKTELKELRKQMDTERLQFMTPLVDMFRNLKKDDIDDRGG